MLYQWGPRTRLIKYNLVKAREFGTCPMDGHAISFGPFRLLPARRLLVERDTPVRLGSRAFDILAALVGQGRPSLRRHRSRTGLQFRRPDKLTPYFGIIAR